MNPVTDRVRTDFSNTQPADRACAFRFSGGRGGGVAGDSDGRGARALTNRTFGSADFVMGACHL